MIPSTPNMRVFLSMLARCVGATVLLSATMGNVRGASGDPDRTSGNPPPSPGAEYTISNWYGEGGLPHNVITQVARSAHGFLWLGTQGGLARFDGRFFVLYPIPEEYSRGQPDIRSFAIEDEQTILVLTGAGRLVRLHDGKFTAHPADAFLTGTGPADITFDDEGSLWIGATTPTAMLRWDGERMEKFGSETGFARRSSRTCVVSDRQKRTWIAGGDFLGYYENGSLHRYDLQQSLQTLMIAGARGNGLWIASRQNLSKLENDTWRVVVEGKDWMPGEAVIQDIYEAKNGVLWIATRRSGLFRLVGGKFEQIPLQHNRVESICEDIDGNVWIGIRGGGLARLKPRNYEIIDQAAGLPRDLSSSVTEDETGALWCANQTGGVVRVKDGKATVVTTEGGNSFFTNDVCADQRGTVWVGTQQGLFSTTSAGTLANGKRALVQHAKGIVTNVRSLFCARNGDLWLSWSNGSKLGRLRDGQLHEFKENAGLPPNPVSCVVERQGADGPEIWVSLRRGRLFQLDKNGRRFVERDLPAALRDSVQIYVMHVDAENHLWLGTSRGLILWRNKGARIFTCETGLPDDIIYQVISDNHGRLWASSRRGIFNVQIAQLLATTGINNARGKTAATLFGRDDNLEGISGMSGEQPMSWKARDGRLWFATYRGIVGFSTTNTTKTRKPPPVCIDSIAADGARADISQLTQSKRPLHIAPRTAQIEIAFSALDFSAPERMQVRRKLEPFDVDWIDATGERSCAYSRLPPGKYTFRLSAADIGGGDIQRSEVSLEITIDAAWWQTKWFQLGAILLVLIAVALIARRLSNRILKRRLRRLEQEKALERERARIARDLHDDLGSRASQISFVADRVFHETQEPQTKEIVSRLVAQGRDLVEDLHRIVWTVNPQNDSWRELAAYIARYAQRHLRDTGIICTVEGMPNIPDIPLSPEIRNHIIAITQETLTNVLKHSAATQVTINMTIRPHNEAAHFNMTICDNGRGFDTRHDENEEGNGLINMRERMTDAGGRIEIKSDIGKGTRVMIDIPLQPK